MTVGATVLYYAWAISAPAYAITVLGVPAAGALWAGVAAQVVFLVVLPFWGSRPTGSAASPCCSPPSSAWPR
jgi:MHS family alpha-ketoglutarate permease-like MFS transporter